MTRWSSLVLAVVVGCGSDSAPSHTVDAPMSTVDAPPTGPTTFTEKQLTVAMSLKITPADGSNPEIDAVTITARDGLTPVITDLWLYTLDAATGAMTEVTTFTSTGTRKSPTLINPAKIGTKDPSGLVPADDGRKNGLMTNLVRGKLVQGAFVATIDGTVVVTLPAAPTLPLLVIAGVEDQRYAGAAVLNPDGSAGTVPDGVIKLDTHTKVTFADVKPILHQYCGVACHKPGGIFDAGLYLVDGTHDELLDDNFGAKEAVEDCEAANPAGPARDACILAITKAEFLVEPGNPAVSPLIQRARPDEGGGTSPQGLLWYGSRGLRYNVDYGDRRMPQTTTTNDPAEQTNPATDFDTDPAPYQTLYDWVAQGAPE